MKQVAIFADNLYQEMELWYPLYRLQEAGVEVTVVGAKAGQTYTSKLGYPVTTHKSYDDISSDAFDGVIIPGGFAPDHMRRDPKANLFVQQMSDEGKLV